MLSIYLIKTLDGPGGKYRLEIDAQFKSGLVLAIMGSSGAGKTSLLRMIAGLMVPESGKITIESEVWYESSGKIFLPPQQRSVGMVFQDYGLFPHMTVMENLQFAIDTKTGKGEILTIIEEMGLQGLERQRPKTLSGGQQQRVALARAFLRKPKILLLDEPLAALDRPLRLQLQQDLKRFQEKLGCTTLIISHDPGEVARLADEVLVLDKGKVQFRGTPETLFGAEGQQRIRAEVLAIPAPGKVRVLVGDQILTIDYSETCAVGEVIDFQIS